MHFELHYICIYGNNIYMYVLSIIDACIAFKKKACFFHVIKNYHIERKLNARLLSKRFSLKGAKKRKASSSASYNSLEFCEEG